jgi:hypothetical protein
MVPIDDSDFDVGAPDVDSRHDHVGVTCSREMARTAPTVPARRCGPEPSSRSLTRRETAAAAIRSLKL